MRLPKRQKVEVSNRFIEAIYKIETREKKFLAALICRAQADGDKDVYSFSVAELANMAGIDTSRVYYDIRDIMDRLTGIRVKYINDEEEEFEFFHFIDSTRYKDGILSFSFSRKFRDCIFELRTHFTKYLLKNIRPLRSAYSIRTYELMKKWQAAGGFRCSIEEFKQLVGAEYDHMGDLRKRVIDKAVNDINQNTDLIINYDLEKLGRFNKYIEFSITSNSPWKVDDYDLFPDDKPDPGYEDLELKLRQNGVKFSLGELISRTSVTDWKVIENFWNKELSKTSQKVSMFKRGKFIFLECYDKALDCWNAGDNWVIRPMKPHK